MFPQPTCPMPTKRDDRDGHPIVCDMPKPFDPIKPDYDREQEHRLRK